MSTNKPTFKRFDKTTASRSVSTAPSLSMSATGTFAMNASLTALIEAKAGGGVVIVQEEGEDGSWFLALDAEHGFAVRADKSHDGVLIFSSSVTARALLEAAEVEHGGARMLVGAEATTIDKVKYWPILTSSAKRSNRKRRS